MPITQQQLDYAKRQTSYAWAKYYEETVILYVFL
jgi:hypothetical protein